MDRRRSNNAQHGFTLIELAVVAMLVVLLAAVAVPALRAGAPYELDLAAREVADAFDYARARALRSGVEHGVTVDVAANSVVVWQADMLASPVAQAAVLYHPVDRQPWSRTFGNLGLPAVDVANAQAPFDFPGDGRRESVLFDASGAPVWVTNPGGARFDLGTGTVELRHQGYRRSVVLAPVTGRVTVQ